MLCFVLLSWRHRVNFERDTSHIVIEEMSHVELKGGHAKLVTEWSEWTDDEVDCFVVC